MKKIIITLLCFINFSFITIGMHYYIEADVKTNCQDNFPSGLSFFFEQEGGYGNKSMVSQTESILGIDLSTFQEYDFIDNEESSEKYWKDITQFESVIDGVYFKDKIKSKILRKGKV